MVDRFAIKIKNRTIGEIITKKRDLSGSVNLESIKLPIQINFPENYVMNFQSGGSCFTYHNFKTPICLDNQLGYAVSLVITAGHCVSDPITFENHFGMGFCGFNKNNFPCRVLFLKNFMRGFAEELVSSNNFPYCLPGDIAVLVLLSQDPDFRPFAYEKKTELTSSQEQPCLVSGFPSYSNPDFECMYPYESNDLEATKTQVKTAFYNFDKLICSEGTYKESGYLLEITCSTYSGMSGSPILSSNKLVGVFCGGPPMPGQREALQVCSLIHQKRGLEAYRILESCIIYDSYYTDRIFHKIFEDIHTKLLICIILKKTNVSPVETLKPAYEIINKFSDNEIRDLKIFLKGDIISKLLDVIRRAVVLVNNNSDLTFNIGISIKHPAFRALDLIINNSENLDNRLYSSYELRQALLNRIS
jgi:Trypsin-like peptidase domain